MKNLISDFKQNISFENLLISAMRSPLTRINRDKFLYQEFSKHYPEEVVQKAITLNPARAGIPKDMIYQISSQVIKYESAKVTGLSTAASIASSLNPAATVPAVMTDASSYINSSLRVIQKLAYLYGFSEFDLNNEEADSETMNKIIIFIGVMFGAKGAATALEKIADIASKHISKTLAGKALTKGTIYPIIKKISARISIRMTKQIYADGVASIVPYVGSILSGGITLAMFAPSCVKLRNHLATYNLCDPNFYKAEDPQENIT